MQVVRPAIHCDGPGVPGEDAHHHGDSGGLAGAVGAQQAVGLTLGDREADVVDRHQVPVGLAQPFAAQNRVGHATASPGHPVRDRRSAKRTTAGQPLPLRILAWHNPIQPAALAPDPGGGVTRPAAVAGPVGTYSYAIALSTFNRAARIAGMTAAATPTTAESTR